MPRIINISLLFNSVLILEKYSIYVLLTLLDQRSNYRQRIQKTRKTFF